MDGDVQVRVGAAVVDVADVGGEGKRETVGWKAKGL